MNKKEKEDIVEIVMDYVSRKYTPWKKIKKKEKTK